MTQETQKRSGAIYEASKNNIYYNLLLDLRDLGYKPKNIVEITNVNPNTLRGNLYKARNDPPQSGLKFISETILNYLSVLLLLEKTNKNSLLNIIDELRIKLKDVEEAITLSLTEDDVDKKVEEIVKDIQEIVKETEPENPESEKDLVQDGFAPEETEQKDFDPEYPGSTEDAPFGFTLEGNPRKIPPRKGRKRRRS